MRSDRTDGSLRRSYTTDNTGQNGVSRRTQHGSDSGLSEIVRKKWSQYGRQRYSLSWTSEIPFQARLYGERGPRSPCIRAQFTRLGFPVVHTHITHTLLYSFSLKMCHLS